MASLHHLVGALLRDLTQARVRADLYTRGMSKVYQQDELLRHFPVPRAEIRDAQLNLKFAVLDVEIDAALTTSRQSLLEALYRGCLAKITTAVESMCKELAGTDSAALSLLNSDSFVADMNSRVFSLLMNPDASFLMNGALQVSTIIEAIWEDVVQSYFADYGSNIFQDQSIPSTLSDALSMVLDELAGQVLTAWVMTEEYQVTLDLGQSTLSNLPEGAISSLQLSVELQNLRWTAQENEDGSLTERLLPDE